MMMYSRIRKSRVFVGWLVSDTMPERLQQSAQTYGAKPYADYQDMIRAEKPDIAVVALPPFLHREAPVFSAEHGANVLLEKPMAMSV